MSTTPSPLDEIKVRLDAVSPSFCPAKWLHSTIDLGTGHTKSCEISNEHKVPLTELVLDPKVLHNPGSKVIPRTEMLKGQRPKECSSCWATEDQLGQGKSERYHKSTQTWAAPFIEKLGKLKGNEELNPTFLDLSFSGTCNFKCSYCSPRHSSTWMEEIHSYGEYRLSNNLSHANLQWFQETEQIPLADTKNPYVKSFWKWWPDLSRDLVHLQLSGGEPLLSEETFNLLQWIDENGLPQLNLSITTNLGVDEKTFSRFLTLVSKLLGQKKLATFNLQASIDTFGHHAEYIRHGLDFVLFENNLCRFLTELPSVPVGLQCAYNNLSVVGFRNFIDWLLFLRKRYQRNSNDLRLDVSILTHPVWQSVRILPSEYQDHVVSHIAYLKARSNEVEGSSLRREIASLERVLAEMKNPPSDFELKEARKNFYLFFNEHDSRRGTSFLKTFPTMEQFWNSSKKLVSEEGIKE